jgi:hypothetical protein
MQRVTHSLGDFQKKTHEDLAVLNTHQDGEKRDRYDDKVEWDFSPPAWFGLDWLEKTRNSFLQNSFVTARRNTG